ncbi:hypothetical protein, variant 4 [Phytophthora nicotianae CJ01A1]|uniref:Ketopantoate reductase N-terminal domain-containing protein n=6 Tax=Phytophthora nicotianae TaxID=4792 RepID=V9DWY4_PHYNI|nr:hypothetical protein, variant 2 [Phytophthora nicotianae INRA-310]XP_008898529.1 hypothetical protein, variant 3 [Phytophthora nicotianae INRA-310]XP_008898530.1 hypothetical protein, variant 4 [Phytophthora nicotianae INRA-310]XP_008898533.1 hypothetical protein, variant 5 [Phytophthora nicotianae INRA-310]ETI31374.1 hypothetical protein, variant 2 [Phytophthora nicotianae P1569]ETK71752.1 hypothetical protein, variant 1 [Phytophthora nicotianae]ETO60076.1 hypothetical protein, variant 2 
MLRICSRNPSAYRSVGRSIYSVSCLQNVMEEVGTNRSNELRVGVLGLGAIGTIFFTRLGRLAASVKAKRELPTLTVDAFVKAERFENWTRNEKLQLCLQVSNEETLAFRLDDLNEKVATVLDAPNVRVRTLDSVVADDCDGKLDVLLVAVKAYDNVKVIHELREKSKHLMKDGALCVLLQNGLGEVPRDGENALDRVEDRWEFANGVTFVGGRVVEFGSVVTSGLDVGMTYLAPFGGSEEEKQRSTKIEMLTEIFLAAGLRCEILEPSKMQAMLWRKLIVNAAINPLACLLNAPNKLPAKVVGIA